MERVVEWFLANDLHEDVLRQAPVGKKLSMKDFEALYNVLSIDFPDEIWQSVCVNDLFKAMLYMEFAQKKQLDIKFIIAKDEIGRVTILACTGQYIMGARWSKLKTAQRLETMGYSFLYVSDVNCMKTWSPVV